ncbi:MAG: hypothetical protein KDB80_01630 [Planctomycetes bacterium]|nr:hypothetical protein [Planctomycetota bacterium]
MESTPLLSTLGFAGLLAVLAPAQSQATLTIFADRDNTIWNQSPTCCSNGAGTHLFVGTNGIPIPMRTLVHFDIAGSLPQGATIVAAELSVNCLRTRSAGNSVDLHRLTADWGEGGSFASGGGGGQGGGASSIGDDANWFARFFSQGLNWTSPGGDFDANATSNVTIFGVGSYLFATSPSMVADVQGWLDTPSTNFGWILIGDEPPGSSTSKQLASRENGANGPRVRVTFTAPDAMWGTFGNPCDTMASPAPSLGVDPAVGTGQPTIGQSMRLQVTQGATAMSATAIFLGGSQATPPITLPAPYSCDQNVQPLLWGGATDMSLGLTLAIPNNVVLAGLELYWQAFGAANPFRLVATNGVMTRLGL